MGKSGYISITELGLGKLQWKDVSGWCSLESLKAHLIVEHDVDDQIIKDYAVSAWNLAETTIERPLRELTAEYAGVMPAPIVHAVRLLVGRFYAEREGESFTNRREIGFGISALLMPYKGITRKAGDVIAGKVPDAVIPSDSPFYKKYAPIAEYLGCQICELTEWEMLLLAEVDWKDGYFHNTESYLEYTKKELTSRFGASEEVAAYLMDKEASLIRIQPRIYGGRGVILSLTQWYRYWRYTPEGQSGSLPTLGIEREKGLSGVYSLLANHGYIVDETGDAIFNGLSRYFGVLLGYDYAILSDEETLMPLTQVPYSGSLVFRAFPTFMEVVNNGSLHPILIGNTR